MPTTKPNRKAAGGIARASKLSPERRKEISENAIKAKKEQASLLKATHGSAEKPLRLGDIEIPCYVLEDETRVLSQRGLLSGLGMAKGSTTSGDDQLTVLANTLLASDLLDPEKALLLKKPIEFKPKHGGRAAHGYPATVLADLCEAVLESRSKGTLPAKLHGLAKQCEILIRGFARVGIIALVDEATGYQKDRARDSLAKILETWVAKELQPYVRTFPPEFYEEMFRLRGLPYPPENPKFRPQYFGVLTNDIVYERLAPGLLEELKKQSAKDEKKAHLHRRLTLEVGHPRLKEHLASVTTAMKLSSDYQDFIGKLNRIHPRFGQTYFLDLEQSDR
ncbi:P63C domain-containing protein [Rhodoferax sp. GW822-FHT02A01]|uniref:P63C domain-containing protein n=1 Tax=Rhodoferax sp. GW822-FHT02A01 TaxID=3141537 RepID=UPI00315D8D41